jgi:hypothetical protein
VASAASGASGVAGGISGAIGGLTGIVGAIGSIGSFITGIIGDVQQAHANKVLGQIEQNTRYTSIVLQQLEPMFVDSLGKIASGMIAVGGSSTGYGSDHLDLVKLDDDLLAIEGQMRVSALLGSLPAGGVIPGLNYSGAGTGGNVYVTMNITSNDPTAIARQLATMLRSRGVKFTPQ